MSPAEFKSLKADIAQNGQRDPIVLWESKIVDGRHRQQACEELGLVPHYEHWDEKGTIAAFVISKNLERRNLNKSQRGLLAAALLKLSKEESEQRRLANLRRGKNLPLFPETALKADSGNGQAAASVGQALGVSPRTIERASRVLEQAPEEVVEKVRTGEKSLNEAEEQIAESDDQSGRDEAGAVIPESLRGVFEDARQFESARSYIARAKGLMERLASLDCGAALRFQADIQGPLDKAHAAVRFARPHTTCPHCRGVKCTICNNRGWFTEHEWNQAVPEIKAAHLAWNGNGADKTAEDNAA